MCGVEGCGEQAGVDGGCDELFEGARGGEVEGALEGGVGEGFVGAREREEGEEEELLVLGGAELGEVGGCWRPASAVSWMEW